MKSMIQKRNVKFSAKYRILAQGYFLSVQERNLKSVSTLYPSDIVIFVNGNSLMNLLRPKKSVLKMTIPKDVPF